MNQHEINHLRKLIAAHNDRLRVLEIYAARYGWATPPEVQNEIAAIKATIASIEQQLADGTLASYEQGQAILGTAGTRIAALDRRYLRLGRAGRLGIVLLLLLLVAGAFFALRSLTGSNSEPAARNPATPNAPAYSPTETPTFTPTASVTPTPSATASPPVPRWPIVAAGAALEDGAHVAHTLTLIGGYPAELPQTNDLWIFIKTPSGLYYPQSLHPCAGEATPKQQGRWEMRVDFGQPGASDIGKIFEILVTAATPGISRSIGDTVRDWCQHVSFPGLAELPPGLVVERTVVVIRTAEQFAIPSDISTAQLPGQVAITSPISGTLAPRAPAITGTFADTGTARIWVLVHPINGRWYPQSASACRHIHTQIAGASWSAPAILGGDANAGEPFDIVVALADAEAHAFLDAKQAEWCAAGTAPGLLTIELPPGLTQKAHIRVIRE